MSVEASPIGSRIESRDVAMDWPRTALSRSDVILKLQKFGLQEYEVELLVNRYIDDRTLQDLNWTNESSARYHIRKTLRKLKEGKFKL